MTSSLWLVTQLVSHAPVVSPSLPILINHPNQKDPYYCYRASPDLHATKTDRQKEKEKHYCPSVLMSPLYWCFRKALRSCGGDPWELQVGWSFALGGILVSPCLWLDTEASEVDGWWKIKVTRRGGGGGGCKQQWSCALPCSWVWVVPYGPRASLRIILMDAAIKGGFTSYYVNNFKSWGFVFKYKDPAWDQDAQI